jgi:hypothetical protein
MPTGSARQLEERAMHSRIDRRLPALKHGAYSATAVLPGESRAEFEKLHRDLIAELDPNGALENDIVANMARLVWRKKNLETFRIAELARLRFEHIRRVTVPEDKIEYPTFDLPGVDLDPVIERVDPAVREAAIRAADDQARKELGYAYEFVEIGATASVDHLMKDLEVQDRLDAMIDKCLKRLLFLRGLKSMPSVSTSAPRASLTGPSKAA